MGREYRIALRRLGGTIAVVLLTAGVCPTAASQRPAADSTIVSLRSAVAESADNPSEGEKLLREVVREDPAATDPVLGSAAYWLGTLVWEQGRREEALDEWARGWFALGGAGQLDLRLGDRLLWGVFEAGDEARYGMASDVYLTLLDHLDDADTSLGRISSRILVPLRLILPDSLRTAVGLSDESAALEGRIRSGAGARLVGWWRAMDALPATARNERLIEHLRRAAVARELYPREDERGFDDRGAVYVRFGAAQRSIETRLNPFDIGQSHFNGLRGIRTDASTPIPSIPRNEFWTYPGVSREAQYLFVRKRRGEFHLGTIGDLIPAHLRSPRYSRVRLKILESILERLALLHPLTYSAWYEEVAGYMREIESEEISAELERLATGHASGVPELFRPRLFTEYYFGHHEADEERAIREREVDVPNAFFDDFGERAEVPVVLRTARYLNKDGSTRLEVYWAAPTADFARANRRLNGAARDEPADYLVEVSVVDFDSDGRRLRQRRVRSRVEGVREVDPLVLGPQVVKAGRIRSGHRLGLQWDVRVLPRDTAQVAYPAVGLAVVRLDSLDALESDRKVLEMSDLKPVVVNPESGEAGAAFPSHALTASVPLGLQFEIYHLTFGSDDGTHYTISYRVDREERSAFRTRARQPRERQSTTASSAYHGRETTSRETIVLDLADRDHPGRIRIRVRVRDDVSGQEVERAVEFDLTVDE